MPSISNLRAMVALSIQGKSMITEAQITAAVNQANANGSRISRASAKAILEGFERDSKPQSVSTAERLTLRPDEKILVIDNNYGESNEFKTLTEVETYISDIVTESSSRSIDDFEVYIFRHHVGLEGVEKIEVSFS